jgi:hypothetical protein
MDVNFTVNPITYNVSLSPDETVFADLFAGYAQPAAKTVTITNTGTVATGVLNLSLSGPDAGSFTLSAATAPTIAVGGKATFTVRPKAGLAIGTYNVTINATNVNVPAQTATSSFVVNPVTTTLSPDNIIFNNVNPGYGTQAAKTVTIKNTSSSASGTLNIVLSGANAASFTLSKATQTSLGANASGTFTIAPKTGLASGTYTATVIVSSATATASTLNVSFTVN